MSSTSTTWTTDTNTKSGAVQIYTSNISVLRLVADEGTDAILDLFADQGDDNADKWRMWVNASDDDLHFSNYTSGTAYTDILTLQDGGSVGIGTSTPGNQLEIASDGATLEINATGTNTNAALVLSGAGTTMWTVYNDATGLGSDDVFAIADDDSLIRMAILQSGNIGIGSSAPTALLEVEQGASGGQIAFKIDNDDTDKVAMSIEAANIDADVIDITADAVTTSRVIDITADGLTTGNALYIDDNSASNSTRNTVYISQTSSNATNAQALYVVSGGGRTGITLDQNYSDVNAATIRGMIIDVDRTCASGTANFTDIGIDLDVNAASNGGTTTSTGLDIDVTGATGGTHTAIGLTVDVGSADTNYAALFNGGNVGIGTSTPGGTSVVCEISSAATAYLRITGDAGSTGSNNAGVVLYEGSTQMWQVFNSGGSSNRFEISDASGDGVHLPQNASDNTWTHVSDLTRKTDISLISDALSKVNSLRGVNFKWKKYKEDASNPNPEEITEDRWAEMRPLRDINRVGVIAQEVNEVLPEAVDKSGGDGGWGVSYTAIIPLLIEAVKELSAKVTALENV